MSSYCSFRHGWRRHFKPYGALLAGIAAFTVAVPSSASQLKYIPSRVGFIVEDPHTHHGLPNSEVTLTEVNDPKAAMSLASPTPTVDLHSWKQLPVRQPLMQIALVPGQQMVLRISPVPSGLPPGGPPIKDIYIVVRASLLDRSVATPAQVTSHAQIEQSGVAVGGSVNALVQHDAGVATDSSGQQHVRGEHAEEAYVIDGVPLPDTLSGRQGSILSLDTVESVQFLTGSYPPEYGGQTAAVLDITTLPAARHFTGDLSLQGGSYSTTNGDLTLQGPIGKKAGYVLDLTATRTDNIDDPQQPSPQTTNNAGASVSEFAKVRYKPASSDTITFTMDNAPNTAQLSNRSGLPSSFVNSGQGYGFLGLRDQNGIVPPAVQLNPGGLGSSPLFLPSQVVDGMDITQREQNEYAVLEWQHRFKHRARSVFAVTLLHSGQEVNNNNPAVNILSLPLDNSIEYNPTVARNVHHVQFVGSLTLPEPKHRIKAGFLLDDQSGNESYNLIPASQLALDALYGSAPNLAPPGSVVMQAGANGASSPQLDVNGYAVYHATGQSPTVHVHRSGFYRAAYIQDTWQESHRLTINYGLRYDWYYQGQNLGQPAVDGSFLSPRYNFAYTPDRLTSIRFSADKLFNYPPIAQGSVVGAPIQPETLWQYDFSIQRQIARGQTVHLAYYIKDIKNQVDTGLLIPGSPLGLYSAVNFSHGGVHGIEFEYDDTPPSGHGFNNFVNYTYSIAAPAGVTNTGQISPQFNDHDERNTIGIGSAYTWKNEADASLVYSYGSGLASSVVVPSVFRSPNTEYDLHFATGKHFLGKAGQLQLDIMNLFNERSVVNFESGFSGTRFQQGRRIYLSIVSHF